MRALIGLLGRIVTVVLVLEVADVPLICSDEWPVSFSGSTSKSVVTSPQSSALLADTGVIRSGAVSVDGCACPCHFNFRSSNSPALAVMADFVPLNSPTRVSAVSPSAASLDHPPQNLL